MRSHRLHRLSAAYAGALALLLCGSLVACGGEDDGAACAPLVAVMNDADALANQATTQVREGLSAAIANPPTAGDARCPIDVNRGIATHRAVRSDQVGSFDPPNARDVRGRVGSARIAVQSCGLISESERQQHMTEIQGTLDAVRTGHDVVLLERSRIEAQIQRGEGTFTPGRLEARLLVWSYAESRFVCAADVTSTNGDQVGVSSHRLHSDSMNADLDRRAALSGARELRVVAP